MLVALTSAESSLPTIVSDVFLFRVSYDIDYISCAVRKFALHGTVTISEFPTGPTDVDVKQYIQNNANDIQTHLDDAIQRHVCIKCYAMMDVLFYRSTADGCLQQTTARFRTPPAILSDGIKNHNNLLNS